MRFASNTGLPHELGHNVGGLGDLYPGTHDLKTLENPWTIYVNNKTRKPKDIHEVMGFARGYDDVVFRKTNYKTLFDKLKTNSSSGSNLVTPTQEASEHQLIISGRISGAEESCCGFVPEPGADLSIHITAGLENTSTDPESPYLLIYGYREGAVLQEVHFNISTEVAPPEGYDTWPVSEVPFVVVTPFPEETEWIELLYMSDREETLLARIERTLMAPEVTLLTPLGGVFGPYDDVFIEWEATDEDSEQLFATLYYSPNGDTNWQVIADQVAMERVGGGFMGSYVWNTGGSPGTRSGSGRIRIVVSDGLNSGSSIGEEGIVVEGKPPVIAFLNHPVSTDPIPMPDGWEVENGLDPVANDASEDPDGDGFTNEEEYQGGSDPRNPESVPETTAAPEALTYPQLALGGDYQCILMISNLTGETWEGRASLQYQNNQPWPGNWSINGTAQDGTSSFEISLPAYATQKFELTGSTELYAGYLQVAAHSGYTNESISLSFFYNLLTQHDLIDSIGVESSNASSRFIFPVERISATSGGDGRTIDTGIAWAPVGNDQGLREDGEDEDLITLTLFDQAGAVYQQLVVPFTGHYASFFSEVFDGVPEAFLGKVLVEAEHPIHLTVLRLEKTQPGKVQLTSIPPDPLPEFADSAPLTYSQLALGAGYKSVVMISNNSDSLWAGRVELLTGTELDWPGDVLVNEADISQAGGFEIELPAQATRKFVIVGDPVLRAGYLRIEASEGFSTGTITSAFFYNYGTDAELIDSTGVSPGQPSRQFVFPVERSSSVDTGFAWALFAQSANGEEKPAEFNLTLSLFDEDGNLFRRREEVPFEGHFARFISQVFDEVPDNFLGSMRIEAEQEIVLTVIRLEMTSTGFQLTAVPPSSPAPTFERLCATLEGYQEYLEAHSDYAELRRDTEGEIDDYVNAKVDEGEAGLKASVTTIPVVFHVIYKTTAQNISDAQIKSQLDILNKDFRKLNTDTGKVPNAFKSTTADTRIQFKLTVRAPDCKPTTGITRTKTTKDTFVYDHKHKFTSQGVPMKFSSSGGVDAWPRNKYLNIWVCNLHTGLLGFSTFPGDPANVDGVVIDYEYLGNTGTAKKPFHLGRTATHEIGHWLDLKHIWGDDGKAADKCSGSDFVNDTPNQYLQNTGCPSFPTVSCNNGPNGDVFMDYMDYCDDKCLYMFTNGQADRMHAALFTTRSKLLGSDALIPPESVSGPDLYSQDSSTDTGEEPNTASNYLYRSNDIWIRNNNDGLTNQEHQNPIASQTNYIYVRVRNRGCSDAASATVKLYWAKASTGLSWPKPWDGSVTGPALMGGSIGEKTSGVVKGRDFTILGFPWIPPNPSDYSSFGADKTHFCLLSRIETSTSSPYGMTSPETSDLNQNVRKNNNIAWKNVSVTEKASSGSKEGHVIVANYFDEPQTFNLVFSFPQISGKPSLLDFGEIRIDLGGLFDNWVHSGGRGEGFEILDPPVIRLVERRAVLEDILLDNGELMVIRAEMIPFLNPIPGRNVYGLNIEQYLINERGEGLVGGQTLVLKEAHP